MAAKEVLSGRRDSVQMPTVTSGSPALLMTACMYLDAAIPISLWVFTHMTEPLRSTLQLPATEARGCLTPVGCRWANSQGVLQSTRSSTEHCNNSFCTSCPKRMDSGPWLSTHTE